MVRSAAWSIAALTACLTLFAVPVIAQETPAPPAEKPAETTEASEEKDPFSVETAGGTFKFGLDYYLGLSNYLGKNKDDVTTDQIWAGQTTFTYSNANFNFTKSGPRGDTHYARVSFGIGDKVLDRRFAVVDQPLEAYYTYSTAKGYAITLGKFFTPFGQQQWEYEPLTGIQLAGPITDKLTFSIAGQYNETLKRVNGYARLGIQATALMNIGISGGVGEGLSYSTSHDTAYGLDLYHDFCGKAALSAEWFHADSPKGEFDFGMGDFTYYLGKFSPFVRHYTWKDDALEEGNFRSSVIGTGYTYNKYLSFEGAYSKTAERDDIYWIQAKISF